MSTDVARAISEVTPTALRVRASHTRVLVVGAHADLARSSTLFIDGNGLPQSIVGFVVADNRGGLRLRNEAGDQVWSNIESLINSQAIDEVVEIEPCHGIQNLSYVCAIRGITFKTLLRSPLGNAGHYTTRSLGNGEYLLSFQTVPRAGLGLAIKRLVDIAGALVGLMVCALVAPLFAYRIQRETDGSVIFSQTRIGRNGRLFTLYKFRTMHVSAEERLHEVKAHNDMNGNIFKMRNDPRITKLGRFMRRYHIDELPQFWNVLRGEMSLVGTRPPLPREVAGYSAHHKRRLSMKPGLTGLWQLQGTERVKDFEEIVSLDCQYIDRWSLRQDCKIIAATLLKCWRGGGL